jgi:hypothetical protein
MAGVRGRELKMHLCNAGEQGQLDQVQLVLFLL